MDFSLTEEQEALRDLTQQIVDDRCTLEHQRAIADSPSGTDLELWQLLGTSGLIDPGLGWLETCVVLAELARGAAPVPAFAVMGLVLPALDADDELRPQIAAGDAVVVAALHEPTGDVFAPTATVADGRLTGTKTCVIHGMVASHFVVSAASGLYVVAADADGVTRHEQATSSDAPDAHIEFDGAPCRKIGDASSVADLVYRGMSAAAVMTGAACEAAVALLAAYAVEREQFGQPIAAFQAVSQRAGNAYIDTEAVRLTAWHAASRLADGLPAERELLTAKFWAAEGGWRALHGALHIHGGVGVDRDYPLHRHFLLQKQLELHLGSATPTLVALGKSIADGSVAGVDPE